MLRTKYKIEIVVTEAKKLKKALFSFEISGEHWNCT